MVHLPSPATNLAALLLPLLMSACSLNPFEPRDGPPPHPVDVSKIPDAQPRPVVRTRAGNSETYQVLGKTYRVLTDSQGYHARGMASWYGSKFHGRPTANGETYDMLAMTAAHKTLPIPSYVRVTNLSNDRAVVVKINDRGPFVDDRLIDLSYAAAKKLGMAAAGVAPVEVVDVTPTADDAKMAVIINPVPATKIPELVPSPAAGPQLSVNSLTPAKSLIIAKPEPTQTQSDQNRPSGDPKLYLQVGAFQQRQTAISLKSLILGTLSAPVNVNLGKDRLHRVRLGPTADEEILSTWQKTLAANGIAPGFVVRQYP